MSLRSLGIFSFAVASVFLLAAMLASHPIIVVAFSSRLRQGAEFGIGKIAGAGGSVEQAVPTGREPAPRAHVVSARSSLRHRSAQQGAVRIIPNDNEPFRRIDLAPPGPNDARTLAHETLPPRANAMVTARLSQDVSMPMMIAPDLPPGLVPDRTGAPEDDSLTRAQRLAVTARLKENLTKALLRNFSLFLYVSTAPGGPLAQRLFVFQKNAKGAPVLVHDWAASTGREQYEVSPSGRHTLTDTPRGYYELDPKRMYVRYHSASWNQPMPYSMFFNWENRGLQTGLAIHAANGNDIAKLGNRASAGCVHLSPEHARLLYNLIRSDYRGVMPRFAYDRKTQTMSNDGELMRDRDGNLKMTNGYQVLIFIENFGGRHVAAALD